MSRATDGWRIVGLRARLAGLVAALAAASLLLACSSPDAVEEKEEKVDDLDAIVESHLEARGGKEKLQGLQSVRETGTVTASDGRVAGVVREIERPGRFRLEFEYQGTTSVFAHDGETAWQVAPLVGQFDPLELPAEEAENAALAQRDIEGPLLGWREKGHTVELVGRESLPSGEAWKLAVVLDGGAERTDYVDVASGQIVRSDVVRTVRGEPVQLENTFSDFREVDGIVFPHRIETRAKNRPQTLRIDVETIEIDPDLADDRFHLPR